MAVKPQSFGIPLTRVKQNTAESVSKQNGLQTGKIQYTYTVTALVNSQVGSLYSYED